MDAAVTGVLISTIIAGVLTVAALAAVYFIVRLWVKNHQVGAFECAYRRDFSAGWTAGMAHYELGRLEWYRLVSFRWGPDRAWDREAIEINKVSYRGEGEGAVVEVHCTSRESRFILALRRSDYNGLVSWLEGAPPHSEIFF